MKKYIILFSILLASCNAPVNEPQGAGYWIGGDGTEKYVIASDELTGGFDVVKGEKIKIQGYLEDFALSRSEADELIMSARNIVYKD